MEKFETESEEVHTVNTELATMFRLLSNLDAVKILYRAGTGIENSTYAMEELDLTPKKYYYRLNELLAADLVKKVDGVYRQTALGRIIYDRFIPAMGKTVDAKDELELIVYLEGTELENGVRSLIEDKLEIPSFAESTNVRFLRDYESLAIEVIDLYDSAEESVLLASNYLDVRILDAAFRSMDRGVKNRCIIGKEVLSSKLQQLRMILSPKFAKVMMKLGSNSIDLVDIARVIDLQYSFCVVDGYRSIFEFYNPVADEFIIAFLVKDKFIGEKLTKIFNELWKTGECHSALSFLSSFKS